MRRTARASADGSGPRPMNDSAKAFCVACPAQANYFFSVDVALFPWPPPERSAAGSSRSAGPRRSAREAVFLLFRVWHSGRSVYSFLTGAEDRRQLVAREHLQP